MHEQDAETPIDFIRATTDAIERIVKAAAEYPDQEALTDIRCDWVLDLARGLGLTPRSLVRLADYFDDPEHPPVPPDGLHGDLWSRT